MTDYRYQIGEIIGQAAGAASVSWNPPPEGVFDSETASDFVEKAEEAVWSLFEPLLDKLEAVVELVESVEHVVDITSEDFGIQHSLSCRPDLLGCPIHEELYGYDEAPVDPGRYLVWMDEDGELVFESIPDDYDPINLRDILYSEFDTPKGLELWQQKTKRS